MILHLGVLNHLTNHQGDNQEFGPQETKQGKHIQHLHADVHKEKERKKNNEKKKKKDFITQGKSLA